MTLKIFLTIGGFFVLDDNNEIISTKTFEPDPAYVSTKIFNLERYNESEELDEILEEYADTEIKTNSSLIRDFIRSRGRKVSLDNSSEDFYSFQSSLFSYLAKHTGIKTDEIYHQLVRETNILISKKRVAVASQRTDKMVVHAILSLDDIVTTINLFMSRIREWYGIHFPEILKEVENHETFCKIITEIGARQFYSKKALEQYGFSNKKIERINNLAKSSMGAEYDNKDLLPLQRLTQQTLQLFEEKRALENWIDEQINKIAPNLKAIVGSAIAARLIALAGGLQEMALLPSSTIQLLGAEKALFRSLKTGAKPPKHGVIYQTPELHSCKWWQRGNIARAIAGKLTIAARIDAFQGEYRGDELKMDLERKIEEIKEKYSEPPKGKQDPALTRQQKPRGKSKPRSRQKSYDRSKSRKYKGKNYSKKGKNR
ncbi:MAG: C/D box methylation guide ribonucleoprotein complex aNOP56 subunit [Candidatus Heimdallarchaeum endolithica]|uniref:C/D box methylation guide ribonucleoprotein complex aNOP56 subunit n=1 Tax=Candidatus Heimdallarchaeum endolithica TaxID=2876572 RepID=A0A9Y1BTF6_9ARCH|nr:MAG: C/D box methylation guide ribonucleoprotein complex aNOP56 subunit [Candidatus Heimdallarchaeum endolithica]